MRVGRKPKPTHLRVIEGNAGKRKLNKNEPIPPGELSTAPEWLNEEQRATWDYAIANAPMGLLRNIDQGVFIVWVISATLHREAVKKLNQTDILVKSPAGHAIQNPYLPVVNRQAQIMTKAAAEMGFTPSSRTRVSGGDAASGKTEDTNPFSAHGRRPA